MRLRTRLFRVLGPVILVTLPAAADNGGAFIQKLNNIKTIASTVPANGDVNPYGVAVVPETTGALQAGSVLVSNFNNASNQQGTGTTIVQISNSGSVKTFAQLNGPLPGACPGGVGLTTALVALRSGFVVVGSLPAANGDPTKALAGCLIVLDHNGHAVATLSGNGINGPWDMTAADFGVYAVLFVTNVLNGTVAANGATVNQGTVLRIVLSTPSIGTPQMLSSSVVASGFGEHTDPDALVVGPTGVALSFDGTLYVADTVANRITAVPNALFGSGAGTGNTLTQGGNLNSPLGLVIAPNGDLLAANAGDGNLVEIAPSGRQVAVKNIDVSGAGGGTLFGLAIERNTNGVLFVDDGNNTLNLLH